MGFSASYYTQHAQQDTSKIEVADLPVETLNTLVEQDALSNQEKQSELLSKADSYSFQVAHPEFIRSAANTKIINHMLQSWGITHPTYPDFQRAYDAALESDILDLDKAELARHNPNPKFVGTLTKQTFDSVDDMIAAERQAALTQVPHRNEEEIAFDQLPAEQVLPMLKQLERGEQQKRLGQQTGSNGDAWLTLHPEYIDNEHNARLMRLQLATNGVLEDGASIADYETASQQLRASGLLSLSKKALAKQHNEELHQRAAQASAEPGSVFDKTSEEDMYDLPMEELRTRANRVLSR